MIGKICIFFLCVLVLIYFRGDSIWYYDSSGAGTSVKIWGRVPPTQTSGFTQGWPGEKGFYVAPKDGW